MINMFLFQKKYLVIIISIIILFAITMIVINFNTYKASKDRDIFSAPYKTDKQPIMNCFPKFGEFEKCYWKAHTISRTDFGPTSYWMKGFAVLSQDDFERLKKEYKWEEIDKSWQPDLGTDILNLNNFNWYRSEDFNFDINEGSLTGLFYLDFENGIIFFDIEK